MFSQNALLMNAAGQRLRALPGAGSLRGRLVCGALLGLSARAVEYDRLIHPVPALQEHFFRLLTSPSEHGDGVWLEVFEDLALFIREKCLRGGGPRGLAERFVLRHFETCGEWPPDAPTLVCRYYWRTLPARTRRRRAGQTP